MTTKFHQLPTFKQSIKNDTSKSKSKNTLHFYGGSTAATIDMHNQECPFCQDTKTNFPEMVSRALYQKYAASQNYFYSREINEIMQESRTRALISFRDVGTYDESDEYMKRLYMRREFKDKIVVLSEYYKFHRDIPRLFFMPTSLTLSKYHDRKRRIEYMRITKMLHINPESAIGDHSSTNHQALNDHQSLECLLDQLNDTKGLQYQPPRQSLKEEQQSPKKQVYQGIHIPKKSIMKTLHSEQSTLQEINLRLGELIGAQSPQNPYFQNNQSLFSLMQDEDKHMQMPLQLPQTAARKTEPDLSRKPVYNNNILEVKESNTSTTQTQGSESRPSINFSKYSRIDIQQQEKNFFQQLTDAQTTEKHHSNQKINNIINKKKSGPQTQRLATPSQSSKLEVRTARERKPGVTPPPHEQSNQSTKWTASRQSVGSRQQIERKDDLLKLLLRNPNMSGGSRNSNISAGSNTTGYRKSAGRVPDVVPQDPLISQLIERLKEGNSSLFQQLLELTHSEKQRFQPENNKVKLSSHLKNYEYSKEQSNLSSMLKCNVPSKNKISLISSNSQSKSQTMINRSKRVNSQNMESNPFHLNLERVNLNSQQRIQTSSRDTARESTSGKQKMATIPIDSLIPKKVRQRVFSHTNQVDMQSKLKTQPKKSERAY